MEAGRSKVSLVLLAALSLMLTACAGSGSSPSPATATVQVTLQEFAVGTDVATAPAGDVTFAVTNQGPEDVHEFVVIKTDLPFIDLPTDANGAVDEAAGGMQVLGEIEDMAVGSNEELTLALDPGAYALICNIWDETEMEAHYAEGMRTEFTVTE